MSDGDIKDFDEIHPTYHYLLSSEATILIIH